MNCSELYKLIDSNKLISNNGIKHDCFESIEEYLLSFNNEWLFVVGSSYYYLHILGYKVVYKNGRKLIQSVFEGVDVYELNNKTLDRIDILDDVLLIECSEKEKRNVVNIRIPKINYPCNESLITYSDRRKVCIKVYDFADICDEIIDSILLKEKILWDLRECSGGKISDLTRVIERIIDTDVYYIINDGEKKYKQHVQKRGINKTKRIIMDFWISSKTASSAEMFISIIKSIYAGNIYGSKSRGKWFIQEMFTVDGFRVAIPRYRFEYNSVLNVDNLERIIPDYGVPEYILN